MKVDCDEMHQRVETLEEECNRLLDESNVSIKKIEASSCQMNELKDLIVMMEEKLEMKEEAQKSLKRWSERRWRYFSRCLTDRDR